MSRSTEPRDRGEGLPLKAAIVLSVVALGALIAKAPRADDAAAPAAPAADGPAAADPSSPDPDAFPVFLEPRMTPGSTELDEPLTVDAPHEGEARREGRPGL